MKPLRLYKMQGAGNDFLFLDGFAWSIPEPTPELARLLCDRHFGLGADGLALLRPTDFAGANAEWVFFNNDGSSAEMCGNAARCAVRFLADRKYMAADDVRLKTAAGIVRGRVLGEGRVEVSMFATSDVELDEKVVQAGERTYHTLSVDTGVPHAVIEVKDLASYPVLTAGGDLERHAAFLPRGTNVTFFQREVGRTIRSTTFERGISDETLACGTGVTAAALVFAQLYVRSFPITVRVPGGELEVDRCPDTKKLLLRGPAAYVFETELKALPEGVP